LGKGRKGVDVMSRGDRREDIFWDDVDRQDFLKTLAEACQKTDWQVQAIAIRRKNDPGKLAIAGRLRKETTLTIQSLAERVHLGSSKSANARRHGWRLSHPEAE
jgi:hypothetical protein